MLRFADAARLTRFTASTRQLGRVAQIGVHAIYPSTMDPNMTNLLESARGHVLAALELLDGAHAPAHIGAHLDLAAVGIGEMISLTDETVRKSTTEPPLRSPQRPDPDPDPDPPGV